MCADQNNCRNDPIHIAVTIDMNDFTDGAWKVLQNIKPFWPINKVQFKTFTDGHTNKLIGCCIPKQNNNIDNNNKVESIDGDNLRNYEVILIRIYGGNTEVLIDRCKEIKNFKLLHKYGFAPRLLATFDNGLSYEYSDGRPINKTDIFDENVWRKIAKRMAEMHRNISISDDVKAFPSESILWPKIRSFFDLVPVKYSNPVKQIKREQLFPTLADMRKDFDQLYLAVKQIQSPVVFAHNDLLLGNILYDPSSESKVIFIDYEYADYNFQAYDIGNHFNEFAGMENIDYSLYPAKEYQLQWISEYLTHYHQNDKSIVTKEYVQKLYADVNKFALVSQIFWILWGLIQAEYSEIDYDFLEFSSIRFKEYLAKRDEYLAL